MQSGVRIVVGDHESAQHKENVDAEIAGDAQELKYTAKKWFACGIQEW